VESRRQNAAIGGEAKTDRRQKMAEGRFTWKMAEGRFTWKKAEGTLHTAESKRQKSPEGR
jgi:hypothetical protein